MDEKITKEVWFTAAYLYLVEHPKAMKEVNGVAKERYQRRKRVADLRRLETINENALGRLIQRHRPRVPRQSEGLVSESSAVKQSSSLIPDRKESRNGGWAIALYILSFRSPCLTCLN